MNIFRVSKKNITLKLHQFQELFVICHFSLNLPKIKKYDEKAAKSKNYIPFSKLEIDFVFFLRNLDHVFFWLLNRLENCSKLKSGKLIVVI